MGQSINIFSEIIYLLCLSHGAAVDEPGHGIISDNAEIMHTELQHAGRHHKPDRAGNEPADLDPFLMLPAPVNEEEDRDRNHQDDRNDQGRYAAFADYTILKLRHFSSPPQTSTQKPLGPQAAQVSLRAVGV